MDTGLVCYLSYANNPMALSVSSLAGHMFETFIVSEIIKSYKTSGIDTSKILSYYRDSNHREIDLIISAESTYHPIEIKMSAEPQKDAIKHFHVLDDINLNIGKSYVICQTPIAYPLSENTYAIPWQMI